MLTRGAESWPTRTTFATGKPATLLGSHHAPSSEVARIRCCRPGDSARFDHQLRKVSRKSIRFGTITIEALTREVERRTSFCGSVTGKTTPPSTAGYGSPFCPTGSQSPVGADIGVCYTLRLELAGLLAREQRRLFSSGAGIGNGPLPFQWSIPGSRRSARFQGRGSGGAQNLENAWQA